MNVTTKRRARALLIGVEKYENLGPEKQLRAGRNDVLAFWKVCRRLGFAPENIRMLTSPKLEVEDITWAEQELRTELPEYTGKSDDDIAARVASWFPPNDKAKVCLDEATRDNIMAGVGWLAERRENSNEKPVDRILTYSGHGARIEENDKTVLALCPSDLVEDQSKTYLSIDAFKEALKDVDDNMTVVLDCCFAQNAGARGVPRGAHQVATLALGASNVPVTIDASDNGPRVFCASGPTESSYQAMLGGYWYSAFTWAFTVALEQWRIVSGGGNTRHSTVSHTELLFRARMLLEALSFPQHPVLLDQRNNMPVFGQVDSEEAIAEPNRDQRNGQLDPSCYDGTGHFVEYMFYDGAENSHKWVAHVIATSAHFSESQKERTGMEAGVEYWKINGDSLVTSELGDMTVKKVTCGKENDLPAFYANAAHFHCGVTAHWTDNSTDQKYKESYHRGFDINVSKNASGQWTGQMKYYMQSHDTALFREIKDGKTNWYHTRTNKPGKKCEIKIG